MGNHWTTERGRIVSVVTQEDRDLAQVVLSPHITASDAMKSPMSRRSTSFTKRNNAALLDIERLVRAENLEPPDDPLLLTDVHTSKRRHVSAEIQSPIQQSPSSIYHSPNPHTKNPTLQSAHGYASNHVHSPHLHNLHQQAHPFVFNHHSKPSSHGYIFSVQLGNWLHNAVRPCNKFTSRSWRPWILLLLSLFILSLLLGKIAPMSQLIFEHKQYAVIKVISLLDLAKFAHFSVRRNFYADLSFL